MCWGRIGAVNRHTHAHTHTQGSRSGDAAMIVLRER